MQEIVSVKSNNNNNNNNDDNDDDDDHDNDNDNDNDNNFIHPGKRPVSQSTKVDRLVLLGDQHTRIYKILT